MLIVLRTRTASSTFTTEPPLLTMTREPDSVLINQRLEGDTIIGTFDRHCALTLVCRKTGYTMIGKLFGRTTQSLNRRAAALIRHARHQVRTITVDNGTEFHGYKRLEKLTGARIYFATPHHSWERGTSENTNGLIRQYLPKRTRMSQITQRDCTRIAEP
jgi:transposase, IS30 family